MMELKNMNAGPLFRDPDIDMKRAMDQREWVSNVANDCGHAEKVCAGILRHRDSPPLSGPRTRAVLLAFRIELAAQTYGNP